MAKIKKTTKKANRYGKKMMQCIAFAKNGRRCTQRSRGPRFHFLCENHELGLPIAIKKRAPILKVWREKVRDIRA